MMREAIVVLDIGKTNKKIFVYDGSFQMMTEKQRRIMPSTDGAVRVEDVAQIKEWFSEEIRSLTESYRIRAISIATHGAAALGIDEHGEVMIPLVDYTQEVPEEIHDRFFAEMGDPDQLQKQTATAEVRPLINVGKALFYWKETDPERFEKVRHILFYPQYFVHWLTGSAVADLTHIGCHSYLWDFDAGTWSHVAHRLGIAPALPDRILEPTVIVDTVRSDLASELGIPSDVVVTPGIHDSNSSLVPYLLRRNGNFVLNSTGSWCVAMHPTNRVHFSDQELGKLVFYNLSFSGQPVKTSIVMAGLEYDLYTSILQNLHRRDDTPPFDLDLIRQVTAARDAFILPSVIPGAGQFPNSVARAVELREGRRQETSLKNIQDGLAYPHFFDDYERAHAVVNLSVAIQSAVALERAGAEPGMDLYVEGGFRNNSTYLVLLAALFPENQVYLTSLEQATAYGAAICAALALGWKNTQSLAAQIEFEQLEYQRTEVPDLLAYASDYRSYA